jgi:hypothetical protein
MKKTILAWAVMLTVGLTSAFANKSEDINQNAIAAFRTDFASAKNVSWQEARNYIKATFSLNDQIMYAFYNQQGELLGVMRHLLLSQIPMILSKDIQKSYLSEYWISDLIEMSVDGQAHYYISLENGDETLILKSDASGNWKLHKTIKKNIA